MTEQEIKEKEAATLAAKKAAEEAEAKKKADAEAASHSDPVKEALAEARKKQKPEIEKAAFSLKKNAERVKELGGDPAKVLGIDPSAPSEDPEDDDKPVTRGELKKFRQEEAKKTSIQLADSIENEDERELAKHYLSTRILPSGDPQADLADALALVNSVKNKQITEEMRRRSTTTVKRHSSGSGGPAKESKEFEATDEEKAAARIARVKPENMEQWINDRREGKGVVFGTAAKKARAEEEARRR